MAAVHFNDRMVRLGPGSMVEGPVEGGRTVHFSSQEELGKELERFHKDASVPELRVLHDDLPELMNAFRGLFMCIGAGGGLVYNEKGALLFIFRRGMWDLPKGKLDPGEDFATAALREVEEETGLEGVMLEGPAGVTFHTYREKGERILKETRWFRMSYPGDSAPVLQEKEGITDYRWAMPGETGFLEGSTYASIMALLEETGWTGSDLTA